MAVGQELLVQPGDGLQRSVKDRCLDVRFGDRDVDAHGPSSVNDAAEKREVCENGVGAGQHVRERHHAPDENARLGGLASEPSPEGVRLADEFSVSACCRSVPT